MIITSGPFMGLPANSYRAIHADPPWRFTTWSPKGDGRAPDYERMTFEEIASLPVHSLAAEDCALFLWTIDSHLPKAMDCLQAWGFEFKTVGFYWAKVGSDGKAPIGTGYWTRANPEQCWLAVRGKPKRMARDVRRLVMSPRREHSRKPDAVFAGIERLVEGPYIDLFGRQRRSGWTVWGNEAGKFSDES